MLPIAFCRSSSETPSKPRAMNSSMASCNASFRSKVLGRPRLSLGAVTISVVNTIKKLDSKCKSMIYVVFATLTRYLRTVMETSRSSLFRPYARWVITHRVVVVGVILAITGFLASRLGTLQIDSNPDLWAPQQHPYVETTNRLDEIFGGRNLTVIGVAPKSGDIYQPAVLAKIKRLQEAIELLPHAVRHNVLSLAARKIKKVSAADDGMEVRQMMDTIPQTPEEMARLKADIASMPIYINALVSPDGKAAAVIADFKQDASTPNFITLNKDLHAILDRERDNT